MDTLVKTGHYPLPPLRPSCLGGAIYTDELVHGSRGFTSGLIASEDVKVSQEMERFIREKAVRGRQEE
jgi:hypothetical protein